MKRGLSPTELLVEDAILLPQVGVHLKLVTIHPPGEGHEENRHRTVSSICRVYRSLEGRDGSAEFSDSTDSSDVVKYYKICYIYLRLQGRTETMSGTDVVRARKACGWKQRQLAKELGVSQGYVSLLERNRRNVPNRLARRLSRVLNLSPNTLPMGLTKMPLGSQRASSALSRFGYPGFSYLRHGSALNPAEMLVGTLQAKNVEARLVEALPWVLLKYPNLDWNWLLREAKMRDLQNRLGFVVTMARELAEHRGEAQTAQTLSHWEQVLESSRLQREDAFRESLTDAERNWLRVNRSQEAEKWNVLSNLSNTTLQNAF